MGTIGSFLIVNLFAAVLLTSCTGLIFWVLWMLVSRVLALKGHVRAVYRLLLVVIASFALPFVYLEVVLSIPYQNGATSGTLFLVTPAMEQGFQIAGWIWLVGLIITMLYYMRSLLKLMNIRRLSHPCEVRIKKIAEDVREQLGIQQEIELRQSLDTDSPFVAGVRRPVIYLPDVKHSDSHWELMLYHEMVHCLHRDLATKHVLLILVCIHWFNPIVHRTLRDFMEWSEVYCDFTVNTRLDYPEDYYKIALDMVAKQNGFLSYLTASMWESRSGIERRMDYLDYYKLAKKHSKLLPLVLSAVLLVTGATTSLAAGGELVNTQEALYESTSVEIIEPYLPVAAMMEESDDEDSEELVEFIDDSEVTNEVEVQMEEGGISAYSTSVAVNWSVPADTLMKTSLFKMTAGSSIEVLVSVKPTTKYAKVGIIQPNGTRRCVRSKGTITYTFNIYTTGYYRFYVQNENSTSITASGCYVKN